MVNTLELKASIVRNGTTAGNVAKILNITEVSMTNKIKNKTSFKPSEMIAMKKVLNLSNDEFMDIFFCNNVD